MKNKLSILLLLTVLSITNINLAHAERFASTMKTKIIYNHPAIDINIDTNGGDNYVSIGPRYAVGYQDYCGFALFYLCDTDGQKIVLWGS